MNYWWVNHKQTYNEELSGGYIWSPKKDKDGSRNETYLNLTRVRVGDMVFSYATGRIIAVGIVEKQSMDTGRPLDFGEIGNQWNSEGWLVKIRWTMLEKPILPKSYISSISQMLPQKYSPIQQNGNGNQKCYLASINNNLGEYLLGLMTEDREGLDFFIQDVNDDLRDESEEYEVLNTTLPETEKEQIIKARRGQGLFRLRLERVEKCCRLTGVSDKRFLIASHIKPWRSCSNDERLDGNNGLLLSPHVDKLFDKGWISFSDDGAVLCRNSKVTETVAKWGIRLNVNVGRFNEIQKSYLQFHRDNILK